MLGEETKRKMRLLGMEGMINNLEAQEQSAEYLSMGFDARFQIAVDVMYQDSVNKKTQKFLKEAKLRFPHANTHDIYYPAERKLDKNLILNLASGTYIKSNSSVIIQGYASTGKTYIACALARAACEQGYPSRYIRYPDLLMSFENAMLTDGGLGRLLKKYSKYKVLVLDEWLVSEPSLEELNFLFELSELRYDKTSTVFCSLYPLDDWVERMGGGARAESVAERYHFNTFTLGTGQMNMREIYENVEKIGSRQKA